MPTDIAEKVASFFTKYPKRTYPKGQILIFGGEDPEHIFYLVSGQVRNYDVSYRGDEVIVNTFKPYAFFPMSWAINRTPNLYFFKAETPVEVHVVPPDDAVDFVKNNPDVLFDLLARVYRGTDGLLGRIVHLMSGTAKSRLLYELILDCRRFGKQQDGDSYRLETTEIDLAARSGLSRETVNREMQKLKTNGWIKINRDHIAVASLAALESAIGTEI